jgi:hypothetical protein
MIKKKFFINAAWVEKYSDFYADLESVEKSAKNLI